MSETPPAPVELFKHWLKARLDNVVSVQASVIVPGNNLVIQTWTGVVINIYLFDTPIKTRSIKKVLQDSGEIGIGSMFIVDANLLPLPDTRFEPDEWLLAIHTLTHERVYAYAFDVHGPKLLQAHLEPIGLTGTYQIKYGPEVAVDQLRYLRMSFKERFIKGDWHVADFGYQAFWRDANRGFQPNYRRPDNRQYTWRSWSNTTWNGPQQQEIPAPPRPARSRIDLAYDLLEIGREATRDEVKAAFRKRAMIFHPDTTQLPKEEAQTRFLEVTEAYEYIKTYNNWS